MYKAMKKKDCILIPSQFSIKTNTMKISSIKNFNTKTVKIFAKAYVDYDYTNDHRALKILEKSEYFINQWKKSGEIDFNNRKLLEDEKIGAIALILPTINLYNEEIATEIFNKHLKNRLTNKNYWKDKKNHISQNLMWFGCYFYKKR